MAKLTKKDVGHVARLAKLPLSEEEITKHQEQLTQIIDHVEQLEQSDTKNSEPTAQTTGLINITREDEIVPEETLSQEKALSGTDKTYNGYFVVPALLEKDNI